MSLSKETESRLQECIQKMTKKFITAEETTITDFHIEVSGEQGELTILDDENNSLARVHINEWEGVHDEELFEKELRSILGRMHTDKAFDNMNIAKPFSFVLADEDGQSIVDLLIIDDDTIMLSEDLLEGFDEEMNDFLKKLLEE